MVGGAKVIVDLRFWLLNTLIANYWGGHGLLAPPFPTPMTKHLTIDGLWYGFKDKAVKPLRCISRPVWPLDDTIKTAWGATLLLTASLAYPVSFANLVNSYSLRTHSLLCKSQITKHCLWKVRDFGFS